MKTRYFPLFAKKWLAAILALLLAYEASAVPLSQSKLLQNNNPRISSVLTPVLPISDATMGDLNRPKSIDLFSLPSTVGSVVERRFSHPGRRTIFHIQDIHGDVAAQTNLADIITRLHYEAQKVGKALVVMVEGSTGRVESDVISSIDNKEQVRDVAHGLAKVGFLLGEELAAVTHAPGQIQIVGVEDPAWYEQNGQARELSRGERSRVVHALKEIRTRLMGFVPSLFDSELRSLESSRTQLERCQLGFVDYIGNLCRKDPSLRDRYPLLGQAHALSIQEKTIDEEALAREKDALLRALTGKAASGDIQDVISLSAAYQEGQIKGSAYYGSLLKRSPGSYPELNKYVAFLRDYESFTQMDALMEQLAQADQSIADKFLGHPESRALYANLRWVDKAIKFLSLEITSTEWAAQKKETLYAFVSAFKDVREFLGAQEELAGAKLNLPLVSAQDLRTAFKGAHEFYVAAEMRDLTMTKRVVAALDQFPENLFETAFIAGGFHTRGIERVFEQERINYAVVRPQLEASIQLSDTYDFTGYGFPVLGDSSNSSFDEMYRSAGGLALAGDSGLLRQFFLSPTKRAAAALRLNINRVLSRRRTLEPLRAFNRILMAPNFRSITFSYVVFMAGFFLFGVLSAVIGISNKTENQEGDLNDQQLDELIGFLRLKHKIIENHDLMYFATLWNQRLNAGSKSLVMADGEHDLAEGQNFIDSGKLVNLRDRLGVIPYSVVEANNPTVDMGRVKIIFNPLDGGKGENFTRQLHLNAKMYEDTGLVIPAPHGAKATDLDYRNVDVIIETEHGKQRHSVNISLAEIKLNQVIRLDLRTNFLGKLWQPLLSEESAPFYKGLLDSICLDDRLDASRKDKRTYRELLKERNIIVSFNVDHPLPKYRLSPTGERSVQEDAKKTTAGHGQLGFQFIFQAFVEAAHRRHNPGGSGHHETTVRFFYNGDNHNSNVDPRIVANLVQSAKSETEKHVVYMVTTPALSVDKKGGKIGLRVVNPQDPPEKWVLVPDMMEVGQAKGHSKKAYMKFLQAGQSGSEIGKVEFNCNILYINQNLLGDILYDLWEYINRKYAEQSEDRRLYEFSKIFSPNLIGKKETDKNGNFLSGDYNLDGAIGSAFLKLNEFFIVSTDPEVKAIQLKYGFDRILHFLNVPRIPHFTPNKFPVDHIVNENISRFVLDPNTLYLVDKRDGVPPPELIFRGETDPGEPTGNWAQDAGLWADIATIRAHLKGADIYHLNRLEVFGYPFILQNAKFLGNVRIVNHVPTYKNVINFNGQQMLDALIREFYYAPKSDSYLMVVNGQIEMKNVVVTISEAGKIEIQPYQEYDYENNNDHMSVRGLLMWAAAAFFGSGVAFFLGEGGSATILLTAAVGLSGMAAMFLSCLGWDLSLPESVSIEQAISDVRFDAKLLDVVTQFSANVGEMSGGRGLTVSINRGLLASTDAQTGTLKVGAGLLRTSSALGAVIRRVLLHVALRHEWVHLSRLQWRSNLAIAHFINELIAYPLGLIVCVIPSSWLYPAKVAPLPSFLGRTVGMFISKGVDLRKQLISQLRGIIARETKNGDSPDLRVSFVDIANLPIDLEASKDELDMTRDRIYEMARLANRPSFQSYVIFFNTDESRKNIAQNIRDHYSLEVLGVPVFFIGSEQLRNWDKKDMSALIHIAQIPINGKIEDTLAGKSYVLSGREDAVEGIPVVKVVNMPHFSLSLFAYSHFPNPKSVLQHLIDAFQRFLESMGLDINLQGKLDKERQIEALAKMSA